MMKIHFSIYYKTPLTEIKLCDESKIYIEFI